MFSNFSHWRNANQKYTEIPSQSSHNEHHQEYKKAVNILRMSTMEGKAPFYFADRNVHKAAQPLCSSIWNFLRNKIKMELPFVSVMPPFCIYPWHLGSASLGIPSYAYLPIHIHIYCDTIHTTQDIEPVYISIKRWIKNLWYMHSFIMQP